ncbi:hypothetical protein T265_06989 [Opisthorchis viverrini]|uniref:Uncharacterized protein n=1 Tax=Opisthorchis viverrini TaxID=6198 RepID=A0A074ZE90_OPIVI|nr:hypothetical protein T265_06989 [Opisthorchis viverrini]KER25586.1 hypothetical protein T265_06989 [Opisthorchis viverrini]
MNYAIRLPWMVHIFGESGSMRPLNEGILKLNRFDSATDLAEVIGNPSSAMRVNADGYRR